MWKIIIALSLFFTMINCTNINQKSMNNDLKREVPEDKLREVKNGDATQTHHDTTGVSDYDFVVSEAAVGNIKGVPFTVAGFESKIKDGVEVTSSYLDINKKEFVDVEDGTEFMLDKDTKIKVVKLSPAIAPDTKGKIYFKIVALK